jgi:hypothetical protein
VVEPLVAWTPTIAPSDLIFYENALFPEWHNKFLMTVLKDRMLVAIEMNEDMDEVVAQTQYLNNMYGRLRDICVGPNKEIYLATNGQFWSNSQPNTHTIVRLRPPFSGVGLEQHTMSNLKLYPNPSAGTFRIETEMNQGLFNIVQVRDLSGRVVVQFENVSAHQELSLEQVPSGIYFVEVERDGNVAVERLVIRH